MHNVLAATEGVERLVQVGVRDLSRAEAERQASDPRIVAHGGPELRRRLHDGNSWSSICEAIVADLPERVYVSFDVDGLEPHLCPNTGTPVPGGLDYAQAVTLLETVLTSGRHVVGFDLCEVAPGPAGDEWDGNVGARLTYLLCGLALHAAGARDH